MDPSRHERYFPTEEEQKILQDNLPRYFGFEKRGNDRKKFCSEITDQLKAINPTHWNTKNVRLWFNNNKTTSGIQTPNATPTTSEAISPSNRPLQIPVLNQGTPKQAEQNIMPFQPPVIPLAPVVQSNPFIAIPIDIITPLPQAIPISRQSSSLSRQDSQITRLDSINFDLMNQMPPLEPIEPELPSQPPAQKEPPKKVEIPIPEPPKPEPPRQEPPKREQPKPVETHPEEEEEESAAEKAAPSAEHAVFPWRSETVQPIADNSQIDTSQIDKLKYELINWLKKKDEHLRKISTLIPEQRLAEQQFMESECDKILHMTEYYNFSRIGIETRTVTKILSPRWSQMERQLSTTTSYYVNSQSSPSQSLSAQLKEVCSGIFIPSRAKNHGEVPQDLLSLKSGWIQRNPPTPLPLFEAVAFSNNGELISAVSDLNEGCSYLCYEDKKVSTGFFCPTAAIFFDGSSIWAAGDSRVRRFSLSDLQCTDVLYSPKPLLNFKCTMCLWGSYFVLAFDSNIFCWQIDDAKNPRSDQIRFDTNLAPAWMKKEKVDLTKGRSPSKLSISLSMSSVSTICAVGDLLAVASNNYHSVHVYGSGGKIVASLVGHQGGITDMFALDNRTLITASKDYTIRIWSMDVFALKMQLFRMMGEVVALGRGEIGGHIIVLSADVDGTTIAWDLTSSNFVCEIKGSEGKEMRKLGFNKRTNEIMEICEEKKQTKGLPLTPESRSWFIESFRLSEQQPQAN